MLMVSKIGWASKYINKFCYVWMFNACGLTVKEKDLLSTMNPNLCLVCVRVYMYICVRIERMAWVFSMVDLNRYETGLIQILKVLKLMQCAAFLKSNYFIHIILIWISIARKWILVQHFEALMTVSNSKMI